MKTNEYYPSRLIIEQNIQGDLTVEEVQELLESIDIGQHQSAIGYRDGKLVITWAFRMNEIPPEDLSVEVFRDDVCLLTGNFALSKTRIDIGAGQILKLGEEVSNLPMTEKLLEDHHVWIRLADLVQRLELSPVYETYITPNQFVGFRIATEAAKILDLPWAHALKRIHDGLPVKGVVLKDLLTGMGINIISWVVELNGTNRRVRVSGNVPTDLNVNIITGTDITPGVFVQESSKNMMGAGLSQYELLLLVADANIDILTGATHVSDVQEIPVEAIAGTQIPEMDVRIRRFGPIRTRNVLMSEYRHMPAQRTLQDNYLMSHFRAEEIGIILTLGTMLSSDQINVLRRAQQTLLAETGLQRSQTRNRDRAPEAAIRRAENPEEQVYPFDVTLHPNGNAINRSDHIHTPPESRAREASEGERTGNDVAVNGRVGNHAVLATLDPSISVVTNPLPGMEINADRLLSNYSMWQIAKELLARLFGRKRMKRSPAPIVVGERHLITRAQAQMIARADAIEGITAKRRYLDTVFPALNLVQLGYVSRSFSYIIREYAASTIAAALGIGTVTMAHIMRATNLPMMEQATRQLRNADLDRLIREGVLDDLHTHLVSQVLHSRPEF